MKGLWIVTTVDRNGQHRGNIQEAASAAAAMRKARDGYPDYTVTGVAEFSGEGENGAHHLQLLRALMDTRVSEDEFPSYFSSWLEEVFTGFAVDARTRGELAGLKKGRRLEREARTRKK